jgi:hypothetical protein
MNCLASADKTACCMPAPENAAVMADPLCSTSFVRSGLGALEGFTARVSVCLQAASDILEIRTYADDPEPETKPFGKKDK